VWVGGTYVWDGAKCVGMGHMCVCVCQRRGSMYGCRGEYRSRQNVCIHMSVYVILHVNAFVYMCAGPYITFSDIPSDPHLAVV